MKFEYEPYVYVPARDCGAMATLPLLGRALVTYLAKHCERRVGRTKVGDDSFPLQEGDAAAAIVHRFGGNHHDVPVVRRMLALAIKAGAVEVADGRLRLPEFHGWQELGHERMRRLYAREEGPFAGLSFVARMLGAYCIKSCNDDGRFRGVFDAVAFTTYLLHVGGGTERGKVESDRRVVGRAVTALIGENFVTPMGDTLAVKNFYTAQPHLRSDAKSKPSSRPTHDRPMTASRPTHDRPIGPQVRGTTRVASLSLPFPPVPNREDSLRSSSSNVASAVDGNDKAHVTPHAPTPDAASDRIDPPDEPSHEPDGAPVKEPARTDAAPLTATAPSVAPNAAQGSLPFPVASPAPQSPVERPAQTPPVAPVVVDPPTPRRKREKVPRTVNEKAPLPFTIEAALTALESAAKGRFVIGHAEDWNPGTGQNVTRMVRRFPNLARWTLLGEHIASTRRPNDRVLTANWAGSLECANAMIESRAWDEKGRPAPNGPIPTIAKVTEGPLPVAPKSAWADVPPEGTRTGRRLFG